MRCSVKPSKLKLAQVAFGVTVLVAQGAGVAQVAGPAACSAGQTATDFAYTAAAQSFTVPAGVTQLFIQVFGAQGARALAGLAARAAWVAARPARSP